MFRFEQSKLSWPKATDVDAEKLLILTIYQVAAVVSILALVYMRVFLKDTIRENDRLEQLIFNPGTESSQPGPGSLEKMDFIHQIPSPKDVLLLLRSR